MAGGGAAIVPIAAGRRASRFGIVKNQSWFGDLRTKIGGRFFGVSQTEKRFSGKPRHTTTHKHAHTTPSALSSNVTIGMETRARKKKRLDATAANAGEAIPGLLNDIVVTHVLRTEHFDDPADLARLPAVSRAMRDAVSATGLRFEELAEHVVVNLGCLNAVQRLQRGGRLSRRERLCQAAARSGQLEELKALRADGWPWDEWTCSLAALGGHLEMLQWLRANGCPWDKYTCAWAAQGGHLEVLQWARTNGCSSVHVCGKGRAPRDATVGARERRTVEREDVLGGGEIRTPRGAAVGAHERMSVGRGDMLGGGAGRASRGAAVVVRERLPVERENVLVGGVGRAPRGAAASAHERLPMGQLYMRERGAGRAPRGAAVGARERLPMGHRDVLVCGGGRTSRDAAMGACERLPVERGDVRVGGKVRTPRGVEMGARERLPVGRFDTC